MGGKAPPAGKTIPVATYRLQLSRRFGFRNAEAAVGYIKRLGVSDCYTSPLLKARRGSMHCYDVVDHRELNPEIGTRAEFERFAGSVKASGMGLVVDIVPNHMAASSENLMWASVLEYGPSSPWANFFDIDWSPPDRALRGRVLLPLLIGDLPGSLADLRVELDQGSTSLWLRVGAGERVPLSPMSYHLVLGRLADGLERGGRPGAYPRGESLKRRLAARSRKDPSLLRRLCSGVERFNAHDDPPGRAARFDSLLQEQYYLLSHWREASERINYRRFLLINDLVALRAERREVFDESHALLLDLVGRGLVTGLRVDHCDGMTDPEGYFLRLSGECARRSAGAAPYLVAEKILGRGEPLPTGWAICGTTGYDFAFDASALLVRSEARRHLSAVYRSFTGRREGMGEELVRARRFATRRMGSEIGSLSRLLLAPKVGVAAKVSIREVREALAEVIARFPVYRTYSLRGRLGARDASYVREAVRRARGVSREALGLVEGALLGGGHRRFVEEFEHATVQAAVTGVEDTAFYRYNRLVSLNEVGGDPASFGISTAEFHRRVARRSISWPHAMLATSTHDTKRSEDVRARIDSLSEVPEEWGSAVARWSRLNASNRSRVDGRYAPSRSDEYLFYQTLVGAWPLFPLNGPARHEFVERMASYMAKAAREAKEETNWIDPDVRYENALDLFVRATLEHRPGNRFLSDFLRFEDKVARMGMLRSLSQLLLKLTCPGVPDIYQGNETWDFSLVDPDNRREVDFLALSRTLGALEREMRAAGEDRTALAGRLLARWRDGRIKMYVTASTLAYRSSHRLLFERGRYVPLRAPEGVCAFARERGRERCVVVVPTVAGHGRRAPGSALSLGGDGRWSYRDVLTGRSFPGGRDVPVTELLGEFPVALLSRD